MSKKKSGNRAAAATAAVVGLGALSARRRRRLRQVAKDLQETVSPPGMPDPLFVEEIGDDAHAPGHQHLGPPPSGRSRRSRRGWSGRADRGGHGGKFSSKP